MDISGIEYSATSLADVFQSSDFGSIRVLTIVLVNAKASYLGKLRKMMGSARSGFNSRTSLGLQRA